MDDNNTTVIIIVIVLIILGLIILFVILWNNDNSSSSDQQNQNPQDDFEDDNDGVPPANNDDIEVIYTNNPQPINTQPFNTQTINTQTINTQPINTQAINTQIINNTVLEIHDGEMTSNPGLESGSYDPNTKILEEMAKHEELASVEEISMKDKAEISSGSGPVHKLTNLEDGSFNISLTEKVPTPKAPKAPTPKVVERVVEKAPTPKVVVVEKAPTPKVITIDRTIKPVVPIMKPRPIVPQPQKISPYVPPTKKENDSKNEISGSTVNASIIDPGSASSNFSSPKKN
jgi:hypothetical protein